MKTFKKITSKAERHEVCPVCRKSVSDISYLYEDGNTTSHFYSCLNCSFIFASPVFIPDLEERHMDGVENAEMFNSKLLKFIYTKWFINKEIRSLKRACPRKNSKLLDIGCGTGWTSSVYAENGFDVTGIEPSRVRAEIARKKYGLEVISEYIENVDLKNEFDVVVLRHIIEHFADPAAVLKKVKSFLKEDGRVLLVVPNINCLGRYLFESDWAWVLPWHCSFFTPRSVRVMLENEGFGVEKFYQTPSPLYYPGSFMRKYPNPIWRKIFGKNRVFSMLFFAPLAILGQMFFMGDNIVVVARVK